jgi:hypothetical protein
LTQFPNKRVVPAAYLNPRDTVSSDALDQPHVRPAFGVKIAAEQGNHDDR